jgi:hypothetical protein
MLQYYRQRRLFRPGHAPGSSKPRGLFFSQLNPWASGGSPPAYPGRQPVSSTRSTRARSPPAPRGRRWPASSLPSPPAPPGKAPIPGASPARPALPGTPAPGPRIPRQIQGSVPVALSGHPATLWFVPPKKVVHPLLGHGDLPPPSRRRPLSRP